MELNRWLLYLQVLILGTWISSCKSRHQADPSYFDSQKSRAFQSSEEVQSLVNLLVSPSLTQKVTTPLDAPGAIKLPETLFTPKSYVSPPPKYWESVCTPNCEVQTTNHFLEGAGVEAVGGPGLNPGTEHLGTVHQQERVFAHFGSQIDDGALWQISLALAAREGKIKTEIAREFIDNYSLLLLTRSSAPTPPDADLNGVLPSQVNQSYSSRAMIPQYLMQDPFVDSPFQHYLSVKDGHAGEKIKAGTTTWVDSQKMVSENVWAYLIGPLQAQLILNQEQPVALDSVSMRNAFQFLDYIAQFQTQLGAIFSTQGVIESELQQDRLVSLEYNFTLLAGLKILRHMLVQHKQDPNAQARILQVNGLIEGSNDENGTSKSAGLSQFLRTYSYDIQNSAFYRGGKISADTGQEVFTSDIDPATKDQLPLSFVDQNISLLAVSVLGTATTEKWFGENTVLKIWKQVKESEGMYDEQKNLVGMGKSSGVIDGEQTFQAMNLAASMIENYRFSNLSAVKVIDKDLQNLIKGVLSLRNDQYAKSTTQPTLSPDLQTPLPVGLLGFLESSYRNSSNISTQLNPIISLGATSLSLQWQWQFNPLGIDGKFTTVE